MSIKKKENVKSKFYNNHFQIQHIILSISHFVYFSYTTFLCVNIIILSPMGKMFNVYQIIVCVCVWGGVFLWGDNLTSAE